MTKHYDYIAIGGGSGGIASINRAAMYGQKCALIEAKETGRHLRERRLRTEESNVARGANP